MSFRKFNEELAGTSIGNWGFIEFPAETIEEDGIIYHYCIEHRVAQYSFALDDALKVFVDEGDEWLLLYNSVFDLEKIERKKVECISKFEDPKVEGIGSFGSAEEVEKYMQNEYPDSKKFSQPGDCQNFIYYTNNYVITVGRFYDTKFKLHAVKYFR